MDWDICKHPKDGVARVKCITGTSGKNKILICLYANELKYAHSSQITSPLLKHLETCVWSCLRNAWDLIPLTSGVNTSPFLSVSVVNVSKANFLFPESGREFRTEMFDVFLLWSSTRWSEFLIYEDITRKLLSKHISLLRMAWKSHSGRESARFGFAKR